MDTERDVPALLADIARIGPFFAVATGPAPAGGRLGAPARPRDTVGYRGGRPAAARIAAVRAALGTDARVAASTAFQGLAAQVVAPLFAAVAVHGAVAGAGRPTPPDDRARAGCCTGGPGERGRGCGGPAPGGHVRPCPDAALADVLTGLLTPLVAAVRARASVSPRVLWGDAASAVASGAEAGHRCPAGLRGTRALASPSAC